MTSVSMWTAAVLVAGTAAATTDGTTLFEGHVEKGLKTAEIVVTSEGAAAKD